jgi:tetratricopeptide (TPR) repeat protein
MNDAHVEGSARRGAVALALALAVVAAAHAGSLGIGLIGDDHSLLGPHGMVQRAEHWRDFFTSRFFELRGQEALARSYYRPLTLLSLRANDHPAVQHAINLLAHLGVCALVFAGARRVGARPEAAALTTAAFGTIPRLTESVAILSGRTDLLASLGVLGMLVVHSSAPSAHARRWTAAALFFAALLCKEVAVAGFVALAALEWARGPRRLELTAGTPLANLLPTATSLAAVIALRWAVQIPASGEPLAALPQRTLFALHALGTYAGMLLSPWDPQLVIGTIGWVEPGRIAVGALAGLGLLAAIAALLTGRVPVRHAGWLALAVASLLPVLHLVPLPMRTMAADRFLYLPLAAAAIGLALILPGADAPRARPLYAALLAGVLLLAGVTAARTDAFGNELGIWEREVARAHPGNGLAHSELATRLAWRGEGTRALVLYAESLRREQALARRFPAWRPPASLLANYGLVLSGAGRSEDAVPILKALVAERPGIAVYQLYLGSALSRALHFAEAEAALGRALALYPDDTLAQQARAQNARAAAWWEALPEERVDEPTIVRARRAQVYQWVGRLDRAAVLWADVARSPDAGEPELDAARRALDQQRQALGETETIRALATALAERDRRG